MHPYGCRAYPLDHNIARRNKLDPRAHLGYLVGYDSTNIYRIWIPSRSKVIRTRDVRMKDDLFYNPSDLDIGAILEEQAEQLIETLDIPKVQMVQLVDDESDDLLKTLTVEIPALPEPQGATESERSLKNQQLITPSSIPSIDPTPSIEALPAAPRNIANQGNEISRDFDLRNIMQGSRTRTSSRRSAYTTALGKNNELSSYYSSFVTAMKTGYTTKLLRLHRDNLVPPLTS